MVDNTTAERRGSSKEEEISSSDSKSREEQRKAQNKYQQDTTFTEDPGEKDMKKEEKPNVFKKLWTKLDLDVPTLMMMGKAALPPTIALAMYQSDKVARQYTTLGYLVAVISILAFCIMPRAKFIQTMSMNIIGTLLGSALAMLMVWSGVKARQHTTPVGAPPQRYNSSQSAVLGVWLFFQIYIINTMKAKFPQLAFPTILYAIQVNVAATNGFLFSTVPQCEAFIARLLEAFLTGFAIATGVSLFIIPVTSRKVVTKEITGYIMLIRAALTANKTYVQSLETTDMFGKTYIPERKLGDKKGKEDKKPKPKLKPEVEGIKTVIAKIQELHGKLTADLPFAKREVAYGKMTPDEFEAIYKRLRAVMMPILGLGSIMDLFERGAEINHWHGEDDDESESDEAHEQRRKAVAEWNSMFEYLHEPFEQIFEALDDGLAHTMLRLGLVTPPKKEKKGKGQEDVEAKGDEIKPGDAGFADHLEQKACRFFSIKEATLRHWVQSKGINLPEDYFSDPTFLDDDKLKRLPSITTRKRDQRQLYVLLYIMFLLNSIGRATLEFVKFADEHDQTKAKNKIIFISGKRLKKWVKSIFSNQDHGQDDETTAAGFDRANTTVYMGDAYNKKKDAEHLPPANAWEKFGDGIRSISHFFASSESAFGFRCACATMSIAVIAFLRPTQQFFVEQRLVWSLIMIAISMTPTSGQSIFQFLLRIIGTLIAMIVAFLMWYIPGQHTAGILVFVWLFVAIGFYIPLKRFDLIIVGLISVVTATLIVGYELQVRKIGVTAATATNGQPAYPIYELGPYRLATVAGGLAVAFFWTIFPYPITEHSALRQKLGGALYLSANFYSIMHEQVLGRIRGDIGDEENDTASPGYALNKASNKVFAKQMLTLQGLKMHAGFVKWEFPLGGRFPAEQYEEIIQLVNDIVNYTALTGYASQTFSHPNLNPSTNHKSPYLSHPPSLTLEKAQSESDQAQQTSPSTKPPIHFPTSPPPASLQWFTSFQHLTRTTRITSHETTSLLALLSSSITSGQPLPPYLSAPNAYALSKNLVAVDHDILSLRHIAEPGYAAFAVMAIATNCIHMDLERLLKKVRELVGELDFSFHVETRQGSEETLMEDSGKRRRKAD